MKTPQREQSLELALHLAVDYHQGQKYNHSGWDEPYVFHPIRVSFRCTTEKEQIVALLHDIIEDTPCTAGVLDFYNFSDDVVKAVVCLTKGKDEDYFVYIARVCTNPLAARVKLADLEENMSTGRMLSPGTYEFERNEKYKKARAIVSNYLHEVRYDF